MITQEGRPLMIRWMWLVAVVLVLAVVAAGCESATAIPAGAQQVRVVATAASVQVTPATVHAGDVSFVLGLPPQGVLLDFVRGSAGIGGALTDADLSRLAQNEDSQGLSSEAMDVSCCGNVYKKTLAARKICVRGSRPAGRAARSPTRVHRSSRSPALTGRAGQRCH
jgi:hypothetical protein